MGKILLTGANGFIAAHVLKVLLEVCLSRQLYTIPLSLHPEFHTKSITYLPSSAATQSSELSAPSPKPTNFTPSSHPTRPLSPSSIFPISQ